MLRKKGMILLKGIYVKEIQLENKDVNILFVFVLYNFIDHFLVFIVFLYLRVVCFLLIKL